MSEGVIVAADLSQEWLLPWWLASYQKHNTHPVAFIDLGMSFEKKEWCQKRGELIRIRMTTDFVKEVSPSLATEWENTCGKWLWDSRAAWFQKPLACLRSPFQKTVWIDLDCEVLAPLDPLFAYSSPTQIGIAAEQTSNYPSAPYPIYNSGVIAFQQGTPLIAEWAEGALERNDQFAGDQDLLSHLIAQKPHSILEIPPRYNWSRTREENREAAILHWHGPPGKFIIQTRMRERTWEN